MSRKDRLRCLACLADGGHKTKSPSAKGAKKGLLTTKDDTQPSKDKNEFFRKIYDALTTVYDKVPKAAGKAVGKTADILQGTDKDEMKFGNYVSPEKREFYNTMMGYTKNAARKGLLRGAKRHGYAALGLTPVAASGGMLTGALKGIYDMNKESKSQKN